MSEYGKINTRSYDYVLKCEQLIAYPKVLRRGIWITPLEVDTDLSSLRRKLGNDARPFKNMTGFLTIQSLMQMDEVSL